MSKYYLGIMCGTSLDSIDISMIRCHGDKIKVMAFAEYRLKNKIKEKINILKTNANQEIINKNLELEVTSLIASNVIDFLKKHKINKSLISAIGFAGITLNHSPHLGKSTYLGNPKKLSSILSIPIIADFRQTDIDAGGQGAPLTGFFHKYLNDTMNSSITYINLGGFTNISIPKNRSMISYDTGPANYLIDLWCREKFDIEYDLDGGLASMGDVDTKLLKNMLKESFFKKPPPKSTGFELFNLNWIEKHLSKVSRPRDIDVLSTLTYLTILTVSDEIKKYNIKSGSIFIYGGGAFNKLLVNGILDISNKKNLKLLKYGIDEKNLEATAFAWFAFARNNQVEFKKSNITGAKRTYFLGNIY